MIKIEQSILGICQTNTYYAYNPDTKKGFIVDPADSPEIIISNIEKLGFNPEAILITHGHFDHIMASDAIKEKFNIPTYIGCNERSVIEDADVNLSRPFMGTACTMEADNYLSDGQIIQIADFSIRTIETPGHTIGGVCYYIENEKILFSGDSLFHQSIGRTDFPGGSTLSLVAAIKGKLFLLPDDIKVYPGHMDDTTIGDEKKYNPFCH